MRYPVHRLAPGRFSLAALARPCRANGPSGIIERRGGSLLRRLVNSGPLDELARSVQMSTAVRSASPAYPLPPKVPRSVSRQNAARPQRAQVVAPRHRPGRALQRPGRAFLAPSSLIGSPRRAGHASSWPLTRSTSRRWSLHRRGFFLCETASMSSVQAAWWFGLFVGLVAAGVLFVGVYVLNYRAPRPPPPPPPPVAPSPPAVPLRPAERIRRARGACGVTGCPNARPHSHVDALLDQLKR